LAAVDLDDTLLGLDKTISPANQEAVQSLQARGVHVVLASGRRHSNILRFHEQLGLGSDDPIVSCNGALVQTARTGRVLLRHPLPVPFAREVLAEGARRKMTQNYYHPDGNIYIRERTPWVALYEERTGSRDLIVWGDLSSLLVGDATAAAAAPLKIIWVDHAARIADLFGQMAERFAVPGHLYVTVTDPEYLEFMAPAVNKAEGLAVACAACGVAQSATLAFGDGNNDAEMLRWAGLGVAMPNARDSAKAAADLVAPPCDPETAFARAVAAVLEKVEGAERGRRG
jgi:hypothetical protein